MHNCKLHAWMVCVISLPLIAAAPAGRSEPVARADDALKTIADPSSSDDARERAVAALRELSSEAGDAIVPKLAELMRAKDGDFKVRFGAAHAIGLMGPAGEQAAPALIEIARDPADRICGMAVLSLARLKVSDPHAVAAVTPLLEAKDKDLPAIAAFALGEMGPAAAPATAALIRAADNLDPSVRFTAMRTLGAIGPAAAEAMPLAMQRIKSSEEIERTAAVLMLAGIGGASPDAHTALIGALEDPSADVRRFAARGLGEIGPPAASAAPALEKAMRAPELKLEAAAALYRINGSPAALNVLREVALSDQAKLEVFERLTEIGEPAAPVFAEAITRDARGTRWAIDSLGALGPRGKAGVAALVGVLKAGRTGKNRSRFDAAIAALQKIGPAGVDAVATLEQIAAKSDAADVRTRAEAALRAIRAPASP